MAVNLGVKKRVTLAEIAELAGVATSTVSTVLNNKTRQIPIPEHTRQRVFGAAKKLGYRPNAAARTLATGRAMSVLVVALEPPYWNHQLAGFLRGVETRLFSSGYSLNICTVGGTDDISAFVDIVGSGRADGVLLTGSGSPAKREALRKLHAAAHEEGIPIVGMANVFPKEFAHRPVDIDDRMGARLAIEHLLGHGHRRIAVLGVAHERWARQRKLGYQDALAAAGIDVDPKLMVLLEEHDNDQAYEMAVRLCEQTDLTAMFVMTDQMAVAAMLGLKAAGRRVPEDCAVIGFDDSESMVQFTDPPLTTVYNPLCESGQAAVEALLNLIEGNKTIPTLLPPSLTIRESCGCPSPRLKKTNS